MNKSSKRITFFTISLVILLLFVWRGSVTKKGPTSTEIFQPASAQAFNPSPEPIQTTRAIPSETAAAIDTSIPATKIPESQQKIRAIMETYGHVDEKYLNESYWIKMANDIATEGPANRCTAFEFHGDNYSFYGGAYSMTPESFISQMDYLMSNNYHFVTGPELVGFLEGWLDLPKKCVILTTDSGSGSIHSMPRIIADFQALEAKYGYTPHMQSFIWTMGMAEEESSRCIDDLCWKEFRKYVESGYFTFGSHSQRHADFSTFTESETIWDLSTNIQKIKENLGLQVYGITWPLEACSPYPKILNDLGFKYAYGGWTRGMDQNFTYQSDPMPLCLPRLFPPNPWGVSGRPNEKTLKEILDSAEIISPLK